MEKLVQLKEQLCNEKKKPKNERNKALMEDLQEQIWKEKKILGREYRKRRAQKRKIEVSLRLSLWDKKRKRYSEIRVAKKNERIELEKQKTQKLQQQKKKDK